jgi:hypothetical protein
MAPGLRVVFVGLNYSSSRGKIAACATVVIVYEDCVWTSAGADKQVVSEPWSIEKMDAWSIRLRYVSIFTTVPFNKQQH